MADTVHTDGATSAAASTHTVTVTPEPDSLPAEITALITQRHPGAQVQPGWLEALWRREGDHDNALGWGGAEAHVLDHLRGASSQHSASRRPSVELRLHPVPDHADRDANTHNTGTVLRLEPVTHIHRTAALALFNAGRIVLTRHQVMNIDPEFIDPWWRRDQLMLAITGVGIDQLSDLGRAALQVTGVLHLE